MEEPRNRAVEQPVHDKDRILFGLGICGGTDPPNRNIVVIVGSEFVLCQVETVELDKLVCV